MLTPIAYEVYFTDHNGNCKLWGRSKDYAIALDMLREVQDQPSTYRASYELYEVRHKQLKFIAC